MVVAHLNAIKYPLLGMILLGCGLISAAAWSTTPFLALIIMEIGVPLRGRSKTIVLRYARYFHSATLIDMAEFYWDLDAVYSAYDELMQRISRFHCILHDGSILCQGHDTDQAMQTFVQRPIVVE